MIAFLSGFLVCAVIWAGTLFRRADDMAASQAERLDDEYMRGYRRGLSRKPPQVAQLQ